MTPMRKLEKQILMEKREWQRGGFKAPQHILHMRQHSTNNRAWTPGRRANIHKLTQETAKFGFFGKLKQLMRKFR